MVLAPERAANLLKQYGIHAPVTDERFLSHGELDRGSAVRIACEPGPTGARIALGGGTYETTRHTPLGEDEARSMVDELHGLRLIPEREQARNMLEHLLCKCSKLYVDEGLERLRLDPVYVRENDYRIGAAEIAHAGAMEQTVRLDPEAHDKGGVFAYRPTSRGRNAPKNRRQT